ncbi:MAG: phosphatase PAP2 family protein [Endomicrobia bacterium]|nr:phosphatase PAP2 family protein [Endomicrobiia bacterium]
MPIITESRNFFIFFLILWFLMIFSKQYRYRVAGWCIIIAVTFSDVLSSKILKHLFLRQRPYEVLNDVYKLVSSAGPSFPSSHAVNSFTVAMLIMLFFRKAVYTIIAFAVATLSAYSRVYVGVHYPSDVVFGAVLGCIIGWAMYSIVKKFFKIESKGKNTAYLFTNDKIIP